MKQIKFLAAIVIAAVALSSCTTYSYTSRSTKVNQENINAVPMLVDVRPDFSKRIATESKRCHTAAQAKDEARYQAVVDNKCDVIVDPVYKIEQRGTRFRAYLTGFAGYYQNPRTLYEDINLLKNVSKEDIEKYLTLKDPSILGLLNPASNSEVINIFDGGKKPECKEGKTEPKPAPALAPEPMSKGKKK